MTGRVVAVSARPGHHFTKTPKLFITLVEGQGVLGDGHAGATVQHRSRKRWNPGLPNLRQVHLIQAELFDALAAQGFGIGPGDMGENITTRGIDLLALPRGARLSIGEAVIEVTGLRNPCVQMDRFAPGLMAATLDKAPDGGLIRKAGVMGVVVGGGVVRAGDGIVIVLPAGDLEPLKPV